MNSNDPEGTVINSTLEVQPKVSEASGALLRGKPSESTPWSWQEKGARRLIRESMDGAPGTIYALSVYGALTEIASNFQKETFTATHASIAGMAACSVSAVKRALEILKQLKLVVVATPPSLMGPCTYSLLASSKLTLVPTDPTLVATELTTVPGERELAQNGFHDPRATLEEAEKKGAEKESKNAPQTLKSETASTIQAEAIYMLYPRKIGSRLEALKAIDLVLKKVDFQTLQRAVKKFGQSQDAVRDGGKYCPSATRWFGEGNWRDYVAPPSVPEKVSSMPSQALESLRVVFRKGPVLSEIETRTANGFIDQLTDDDLDLMDETEKARWRSLLIARFPRLGGNDQSIRK